MEFSRLSVKFSGPFIETKPKIVISNSLKQFLKDLFEWLPQVIVNNPLNPEDTPSEFTLNEDGDIFKGSCVGKYIDGTGIILTRKNQLMEGSFDTGRLNKGRASIIYPQGDYYEGLVLKGGYKHGQGAYYYSNGDLYDGQYLDDKQVGKGKFQYADGSQYIGQFIDDEADGHGIFTDAENNRYRSLIDDELRGETGFFVKGKLFGKGEIKYVNGNLYIGNFKSTKRDGKGRMVYNFPTDEEPQTGTYVGQWKRDLREGKGTMQYDNMATYSGTWYKGMKVYGELTQTNGSRYVGNFQDNMFHGSGRLYLTNGSILEGNFYKDEIEGKGKLTFENK